jgi:hypothetical protein
MAIIPIDVATRGYLQGSTLGIANRGYLNVEVEIDRGGGGGGGTTSYVSKHEKKDLRKENQLKRDDEEMVLIMKIFTEICL